MLILLAKARAKRKHDLIIKCLLEVSFKASAVGLGSKGKPPKTVTPLDGQLMILLIV